VIGFGNSLAGDDAAGPEAAARLEDQPGVVVRIVHQLTPELAAEVAAADRVVFVDAAVEGHDVNVARLSTDAGTQASTPSITHALSPQAVLTLAGAVYGRIPPAFLVTIPGRRFALGRDFSRMTCRAIPVAVDAIERLLRGAPQASREELPPIARPT
jgi:hydrogenase maturation protease